MLCLRAHRHDSVRVRGGTPADRGLQARRAPGCRVVTEQQLPDHAGGASSLIGTGPELPPGVTVTCSEEEPLESGLGLSYSPATC